ncbi:hypothetical protein [Streptomyces hygroscopicus]|uniref:hypothetical protein n=1 Tax=Streptomyces hygroscopicus TaxID=1912 RepID=UPI0036A6FB09
MLTGAVMLTGAAGAGRSWGGLGWTTMLASPDEVTGLGDPREGADAEAVAQAARRQVERPMPGIEDMAAYPAAQVADGSHREVIGPLLDGHGASGVIVRRGTVIASWGDPTRVEMAYSATKSVLSPMAGIAHDDGLLTDEFAAPGCGAMCGGFVKSSGAVLGIR